MKYSILITCKSGKEIETGEYQFPAEELLLDMAKLSDIATISQVVKIGKGGSMSYIMSSAIESFSIKETE